MRKADNNRIHLYSAVTAIGLAVALLVLSMSLLITRAKYVAEVGGGSLDYNTQQAYEVESQSELINAIKSGCDYVQLSNKLKGPIIMTGDALDLKNDLTLDLNGNEIERNNRNNLLNVPTGKTLNVVDTAGGGGLYNPIGSVLNVTGGTLNVFGGVFESGPRPKEYFSTLCANTQTESLTPSQVETFTHGDVIDVGQVFTVNADGTWTPQAKAQPRPAVRSDGNTGNIYFDVDYKGGGAETLIERDTYGYVAVAGETNDRFTDFNVADAVHAYGYYVKAARDGNGKVVSGSPYTGTYNADGTPTDLTDLVQVMFFSYDKDILYSGEGNPAGVPNYAAVSMQSGNLTVDVNSTAGAARTSLAGSFYSYFGTWHTSCIYITGGVMTVSTTGEFATVDPDDLPAVQKGVETRSNSAKFSEGACILSVGRDGTRATGGKLQLNKLQSATAYNGSVISVSGGEVTLRDANITKHATISHSDDPFAVADSAGNGAEHGGEFPADRQYRDAAVFVNGGALELIGSVQNGNKTVNIEVNKDIGKGLDKYGKENINIVGVGKTALYGDVPQTTFGILARGRSDSDTASSMTGDNVAVNMHGGHSYGVFGTRGEISLTDGSITLDSDSYCYGVYAINKTSVSELLPDGTTVSRAVKINLHNTDVTIGGVKQYQATDIPTETEWLNAQGDPVSAGATGAMRAASIGVYLDSSEYAGGAVLMDRSNIRSQEMGVAVRGGNLTFRGGGAIAAYNASAVYLGDGNIDFEAGQDADGNEKVGVNNVDNYTVTSFINRLGTGSTTCSIEDANTADNEAIRAGKHCYEIYVPWDAAADSITRYENANGIRVVGGRLKASGKLTVNFRGLYNDNDNIEIAAVADKVYGNASNYGRLVVKSFAVACVQSGEHRDEFENINLKYADINTSVGGGVKVQGGKIVLGDENSALQDITVTAAGHVHGTKEYRVGNTNANTNHDNWRFYANYSGGHAVLARSGSIEIYHGTYTAAYCNSVSASSNIGDVLPTITIYDGEFAGNLTHSAGANPGLAIASGAMSHYGLKVMGGAKIRIEGGAFDGKNGAAMIRGNSETDRALVEVCAGTFGTENSQDGINVLDFSSVHFGAYTETELLTKGYSSAAQRQQAITVHAALFPISVNSLLNDFAANQIGVYVHYGSYLIHNWWFVSAWSGKPIPLGIGTVEGNTENVTFRIFGLDVNDTANVNNNVYDQPVPTNGQTINGVWVTPAGWLPNNKRIRADVLNGIAHRDCSLSAQKVYYPATA